MFTFLFALLKGVFISGLLWIGCILLGKAINKKISLTIIHHLVMFVIATITCILIISYSLTSSLKSTVEEYGGLVINSTNFITELGSDAVSSELVTNGTEYIQTITELVGNEYPLIAGRIAKLTEGNKTLQTEVNRILSSNVQDKSSQIINAVVNTCYQGVLDKLYWAKFKIFMGILVAQLLQVAMIMMVANKSPKKSQYTRKKYDPTEF